MADCMKEKQIFALGLQTSEGIVGFTTDSREKLHEVIHQDKSRVVYAAKGIEDQYGKRAFGSPQFAQRDRALSVPVSPPQISPEGQEAGHSDSY